MRSPWPRDGFARLVLLLHIGVAALAAQPGTAGVDAAELSCLQNRGSRFGAAIQRLLHQESTPQWSDGWALAERYGPAVAPLLRTMLRQESNALKRLLLVGALAAASRGSKQDTRLLDIATARAKVEEQTLALMCLAVGPYRSIPCPLEALLAEERANTAVAVGSALASTRFEPERRAGERLSTDANESLVAAVRGELSSEALRRLRAGLDDSRTRAECAVILRAALLGRSGRSADDLAVVAEQLLRRPSTPAAVKIAAALHLGREGARWDEAVLGEARVRAALSAYATGRARLREMRALTPLPEVLTDPRTRLVLAAAYGLSAPWPVLATEVDRWSREPALADAIVLCLAWRLLRGDGETPVEAREILRQLAPTPATFWLAWAVGEPGDLGALGADDASARHVGMLALQGRVDRPVVAGEVEALLWRSGAHPGRVAYSAWVDLVRDALLAGSDHVSARLQLVERPPLPRGIENSNNKFFLVADSVHRFLTERVPAPPAEYRLR